MPEKIWLSPPHMGGNELKYIHEAFQNNWVAPIGPNVNGFEQDLSNYTGAKAVSVLSSGTAAIHLALILLDVKPGDEIIVSTFTFSGSVNPIIYEGATPIFVDSETNTWNMDPDLLEKAIIDRLAKGKNIKAIILVHLYGMPAQLDKILEIASKYDLPVIEDAAEALGSRYKGKSLGTFGLMGVYSFNGNKIITTSGGGALVSNNKDLINRSRFLATQAKDDAPHYQHSSIGYNYRMSNIVAGIGRGQMEVLNDHVKSRRGTNLFYKLKLSPIPGFTFLNEPNLDYYSNHWLTCIYIDPVRTKGITREDVRLILAKENIESRPLWKPMHLQPVFKDYPYFGNHTSDELFRNGLCLPSGSNLSNEDRKKIVYTISKLFTEHQLLRQA